MKIPEIKERLLAKAAEHGDPEIETLAKALDRRRPARVAAVRSVATTEALREAIRAYAVAHPGASQVEIGRLFNVNPGRVSEAIRGKRT